MRSQELQRCGVERLEILAVHGVGGVRDYDGRRDGGIAAAGCGEGPA